MGAIGRAVRIACRLYHQPAPFHQPTNAAILDQSCFISEPRSVFIEPCHADNALCLSAILARRPAALDHWNGADGIDPCRESKILDGHRLSADGDSAANDALMLSAEHASRAHLLF